MRYLEQYERGIAEFNEGRFFECHDTFEELWMDERGERRRFLQGLIQGAVGLVHATGGNFTGANSQLTKSLEKLAGYESPYMGIDVTALRDGLASVRSSLGGLMARSLAGAEAAVPAEIIPAIRYTFDPKSMRDLAEEAAEEDSA